jgi:hypothetical protein
MSELDVRKISYVLPQKIQTSTVVEVADTNYSSNLSKEFVSKLSVKTQPLI